MRFRSVLLISVLGVSSQVYAENCDRKFHDNPQLVKGQTRYELATGRIKIAGWPLMVTTSSPADDHGIVSCTGLYSGDFSPGFYSRISSIVFRGFGRFNGDGAHGNFYIDGTATVGGQTTRLEKRQNFSGSTAFPLEFSSSGAPISAFMIDRSVCGDTFKIDLKKAQYEVFRENAGSAEMAPDDLTVNFEAVDPSDSRCVNRPTPAGPSATGQAFQIRSPATGKCVDVPDSSQMDSFAIQQWDCAGSSNQLVRLSNVGDSLTLQFVHSGKCLSVGNGAYDNGVLSTQRADCGSAQAQVKLVPGSIPGAFTIRSVATGKCLDIDSGRPDNGVRLQQWDCVGTTWQEWFLEPR